MVDGQKYNVPSELVDKFIEKHGDNAKIQYVVDGQQYNVPATLEQKFLQKHGEKATLPGKQESSAESANAEQEPKAQNPYFGSTEFNLESTLSELQEEKEESEKPRELETQNIDDASQYREKKAVKKLTEAYSQWGFQFAEADAMSGKAVQIKADPNWKGKNSPYDESKDQSRIFYLNKPEDIAEMKQWMSERKVDKGDKFMNELDAVKIDQKEDSKIEKEDYVSAVNEVDVGYNEKLEQYNKDLATYNANKKKGGMYSVREGTGSLDAQIQGPLAPKKPELSEKGKWVKDLRETFVKEEAIKRWEEENGKEFKKLTYEERVNLAEGDLKRIQGEVQADIEENDELKGRYENYVREGFKRNGRVELLEDKVLNKLDEEETRLFTKGEKQKYLEKEANRRKDILDAKIDKKIEQVESVRTDFDKIRTELEATENWFKSDGEKIVNEINKLKNGKYTTEEQVNKAQARINTLFKEYQDKAHRHEFLRNRGLEYQDVFEKLSGQLDGMSVEEEQLGSYVKAIARNQGYVTDFFASMVLEAGIDTVQGIISQADMLFQMPENLIKEINNPILRGIAKAASLYAAPVATIVGGGLFGDNFTNKETGMRESLWDKASRSIDEWQADEITAKTRKATTYDEIDDFGSGLSWFSNLIATQIPTLATMYLSGPYSLYVLGASATGNKYDQLQQEKELYMKSGGLYGNNYSFTTMAMNAQFTGAAEALSERVTFKALKKTKGMLGGATAKQARLGFEKEVRENIFQFRNLKNTSVELFEEGFSESLATISGNLADMYISGNDDVHIFDNVAESFVSGIGISGFIQSPRLFAKASSPFATEENSTILGKIGQRLQDITKEIAELDGNHTLGTGAKQRKLDELETEYANLVDESNTLLETDIKRIDLLHPSEKKTLIEIDRRNLQDRKEAKKINEDSSLTEAQKKEQLSKLQQKVDARKARKQQILSKYPKNVVDKNYQRTMDWVNQYVAKIKKMGGVNISSREVSAKEFQQLNVKDTGAKSKNVLENLAAEKEGFIEAMNDIIKDKSLPQETRDDAKRMLEQASKEGMTADDIVDLAGDALMSTSDFGMMIPKIEDGKLVGLEIVVNKEASLKAGEFHVGAHEFVHAVMRNTLKGDPNLRAIMGKQIDKIMLGKGVEFRDQNAKDKWDLKMQQYDENSIGEEKLAFMAEMLINGEVIFNDGALGKLRGLIRRFVRNITGSDISFDSTQDVKNFLIDFKNSYDNNTTSDAMINLLQKGASGKIFNDKRPVKQRKAEKEFSRAVNLARINDVDLKRKHDQFIQNEDGTPKYKDQDEFKTSPDYYNAFLNIVEGRSLDGLIQQGMTDLGLPAEALREFTRNVKELIGQRFLDNYSYDKNKSLFGWLTGVSGGAGKSIIYRAKGDQMKKYKKEQNISGPSLDTQISTKEGSSTLGDVLPGEQDSEFNRIDDLDLSLGRKTALKENVEDGLKLKQELELSESTTEALNSIVKSSKVPIQGLSYKGVKRLLDDAIKLTKKDKSGNVVVDKKTGLPKLFKPKKPADVKTAGDLFGILDVVASHFGVDANRIIAESDLNGEQRLAAQNYIYSVSTNKDGSHNPILLDMLPEGQDRDGRATGIANTKLGDFYRKGARLSYAKGDSGAGNYAQDKRKDVSREEFLAKFGIRPDGSFVKGTKNDPAIRQLALSAAQTIANQELRINAIESGTEQDALIAKLADGRGDKMFSRNINKEKAINNVAKNVNPQTDPEAIKPIVQASVEDAADSKATTTEKTKLVNWFVKTISKFIKRKNILRKMYNTTLDKDLEKRYDEEFDETNARDLKKIFGLSKSPGSEFLSIEGINAIRNTVVNSVIKLAGNLNSQVKTGQMLLTHGLNSFTGSGKIGDGRLIQDPNNPNGVIENPDFKGKKDNRYKAWDTVANYINSLNSIIHPDIKRTKLKNGKMGWIQESNVKGYKYEVWDGTKFVPTKITMLKEDIESGKKDVGNKERQAQRKQESEDARWFSKFMIEGAYNNDGVTDSQLAAIIMNLGSGMNSPMRKSALLTTVVNNTDKIEAWHKKNKNKLKKIFGKVIPALRYEHSESKAEINRRIIKSLRDNNGVIDSNVWDGYQVFIIPGFWDQAQNFADFKTQSAGDELRLVAPETLAELALMVQEAGDSAMVNLQSFTSVEVDGNINLENKIKEAVKNIKKVLDMKPVKKNTQSITQQTAKIERTLNKKIQKSKSRGTTKTQGASIFDFDETLIIEGDNFVIATNPKTKETERISSEDWPTRGTELMEQGYKMNFDDFVNVRGGVKGPLFQKLINRIKKYGPKNNFILTARPQEAAVAIHGWLNSQGVYIPLKNITGLGNSTGDAKAQWIVDKYQEGFNDIYFVDDAMQNVEAVKHVMSQLDVKGSSVQAKLWKNGLRRIGDMIVNTNTKEGKEFIRDLENIPTVSSSETDRITKRDTMKSKAFDSKKDPKSLDQEFNDMMERDTNVKSDKRFSDAAARNVGKRKGGNIFQRFFIPPSAEDFKGMIYRFLGKGKQGDIDAKWWKENLLAPFAKGIRQWNIYKQNMSNDFKALKKQFPDVVKSFKKKVAGTDFTTEHAIRTYLWNKAGFDIPGLSETEINTLVNHVRNNSELSSFADMLGRVSKAEGGYIEPGTSWVVGDIGTDLVNISKKGREFFLSEWMENVDQVFSPENLNKIEALYGTDFRKNLEKIIYRMKTGSNRVVGDDATLNWFMDWINGSVGAVMFFNMRSALLQTISTVNFLNWEDNNIFAAAKAFANQPQFWSDFAMIFNSPMLKERRAGLQTDVSASELTKAYKDGKSKPQAIIHFLLEKGFLPTQIADSFAIAMGGSTFYRNRFNKYVAQGMSEADAKKQAFLDFQEIAEETQQSSRPDLISNQQASPLGRIILAWQNTPMQMTRLMKKAMSDLVNGRGSVKANVSRIVYYGVAQNIIFGAMQSGLMFLLFGSDEEEEKKIDKTKDVLNGALDTILRGTGVYGALVSTFKNTIMEHKKQKSLPHWKRDDTWTIIEAINLSPPIGSKIRKVYQAILQDKWDRGLSEKLKYRIENPKLGIYGNIVEALTNLPVARLVRKANNVEEALTSNMELWQRIAIVSGWSRWSVGAGDEEIEAAKAELEKEKEEQKKIDKEKKKIEDKKKKEEEKIAEEERKKKEGIKTVRCSGIRSNGKRCGMTTETKAKTWKCIHHMEFKDGDDRDGDGIKEYQCTGTTSSGRRCKNKTENTNKRCYAHQ